VTPQDDHGIAFGTCRTNKPRQRSPVKGEDPIIPFNCLGENHKLFYAAFFEFVIAQAVIFSSPERLSLSWWSLMLTGFATFPR
jgi:hypothetical protein